MGSLRSCSSQAEPAPLAQDAFTALFDLLPVGVFFASKDGLFQHVNPRWCAITGFSEDEAIGLGWTHAIHPSDFDEVQNAWMDYLCDRTSFRMEFRIAHPLGTPIWVLAEASRHPDGLGHVGTFTDMTAQKLAEQDADRSARLLSLANADLQQEVNKRNMAEAKVRENEELLRSFFNAIPASVVLKDNHLKFIAANRAAYDWLQASVYDLIGKSERDFIDDSVVEERERLDRGVLLTDSVIETVEDNIRKDGTRIKLQSTRFPFRASQGQIHGVGVISFDVTARYEAEHALRQIESRAQAVFDTAADGIVTTDAHGQIDSINPAARQMFGAEEDVASIGGLLPDAPLWLARAVSETRDADAPVLGQSWELSGTRQDGESFQVEVTVSRVHGDQPLFTWMMRDITERKRMEQIKSDFVSTVSHELRTPMSAIVGSLGLIKSGAVGSLPDKAQGLIAIAHKNCARLVRLLNDILDIECISLGKVRMHLAPLDLSQVVRDAITLAQPQAEQTHIRFDLIADSDTTVLGDADRLVQVLTNLISNAIKYSPPNASIDLRVLRLQDKVFVSVRDHGPGIPEAFQAHVFKRFARADTRDSREKGGTGLGLSICKLIVEYHKGQIGFTSEDGQGTTFFFELPACVWPMQEKVA